MKKQTSVLLTILFIFSWCLAGAEEIAVKVGGDKTAVIHITDKKSPDKDVSGSLRGSTDLKAGKGALKGEFTLKQAVELQEAKGGLFSRITGSTMEAIGFVNAKIPEDPTAPKALDIKAETVTEGDQSAANFNINIVTPGEDPSVPTGSGEAQIEGDFKAMKSSGKFTFSGGDIKAGEVPFEKFNLDVVEVENKTTISFEVKVPKASQMAGQLDSLPQMAPMLEQQLTSAGLKFEGLEFPAPTEEGESKIGKGKLTIVDLRGAIRPFLGMASGQLQAEVGPDVDVKGAFENMLEVKFDKLSFVMTAEGEKVDGNFEVNVASLDKFYNGYLVIFPAVQKSKNREMAQQMGEFGPLYSAFMELNAEQASAALRAAVESNMKLKADGKFSLEPKEKDISFSASGNLGTSGYESYVTKAKTAGLPVAEKVAGNLELTLKNGTDLVGDMYLYTDGQLLSYYKGMLGKAAAQVGSPPEVVAAVESLVLNQAIGKMSLEGNKVTVEGMSDTSDLTAISNLILSQAAPQVEGNLTGASIDILMPDTEEGKIDARIFYTEFMPGKNEAQIKEAFGLPVSATVTLNAPAEETKLIAVEQPEIVVDGQLAEVQTKGQKLLATSPSEVASGGGAGGGNKWGLIALGVLLLVGVGGFLMFGKKA